MRSKRKHFPHKKKKSHKNLKKSLKSKGSLKSKRKRLFRRMLSGKPREISIIKRRNSSRLLIAMIKLLS
jgi:hypothetical protein